LCTVDSGWIVRASSSGAELAASPVEGTPIGIDTDGHVLWYADNAAKKLVAVRPSIAGSRSREV
jgi:hypothetical protein